MITRFEKTNILLKIPIAVQLKFKKNNNTKKTRI